jgi:hypothetical protein
LQAISVEFRGSKRNRDEFSAEEAGTLVDLLSTLYQENESNQRLVAVIFHIDPYGDTIFNSNQMPLIFREIDWLLGSDLPLPPKQRSMLEHLRKMAKLCQEDIDSRLVFIGD